jgi:hypothetical protein
MVGVGNAAAAAQSAQDKAGQKSSTVRRELTLYELVIPDLKDMNATGKFDRNVLLWLQDAYVSRAIKEHTGEFISFHRRLSEKPLTEEERWRERTDFLKKITNQTYSTARSSGEGVNLQQYVDAARALYQSESVLYAGQLQELAEYIKKALADGVKPDIERFARESYVSMSRMSGAIKNLEGIGQRAGAAQVAQMMKQGIDQINFAAVTTPGVSLNVGRQLLEAVQRIGAQPEKYIQFVDAHKLGTPQAGPWDFEPSRRGADTPTLG